MQRLSTKRLISMILVFIFSFSCFAGCGKKTDEKSDKIAKEETKAETTADASSGSAVSVSDKDIRFFDGDGNEVTYDEYVKLIKAGSNGQYDYIGTPIGLVDKVKLDGDISDMVFAYNLVSYNFLEDFTADLLFYDGWETEDDLSMEPGESAYSESFTNDYYPGTYLYIHMINETDSTIDKIEDLKKARVVSVHIGLPRDEDELEHAVFPSIVLPHKITWFSTADEIKAVLGKPFGDYVDNYSNYTNLLDDSEKSDAKDIDNTEDFTVLTYSNKAGTGGVMFYIDDTVGLYAIDFCDYSGISDSDSSGSLPQTQITESDAKKQITEYWESLSDEEKMKLIEEYSD